MNENVSLLKRAENGLAWTLIYQAILWTMYFILLY